jgi:hypothetical protein
MRVPQIKRSITGKFVHSFIPINRYPSRFKSNTSKAVSPLSEIPVSNEMQFRGQYRPEAGEILSNPKIPVKCNQNTFSENSPHNRM